MKTNNEILEKIRELADLKKLENGCWLTIPEDKNFLTQVLDVNTEDKDHSYLVRHVDQKLGGSLCEVLNEKQIKKFEIIGLPVHLEHLLLAIDRVRVGSFHLCVDPKLKIESEIDNWTVRAEYNFTLSVEQNLENEDLRKLLTELLF